MKSLPRLAVFCSGHGSNFEAILRAVRARRLRAEAALLICDKPGAYALTRAAKHGIAIVGISPKLFASKSDYERFIIGILRREKIDLIVLAGFMRILSPVFIRAYKNRIVNVHPSYLPAFKGAHAIKDAFEAKASFTGVTVHLVNEQIDAGRILVQEKIPLRRQDSLGILEARIHRVEHRLYPETIGAYLKSFPRKRESALSPRSRG